MAGFHPPLHEHGVATGEEEIMAVFGGNGIHLLAAT
jgi:hypothetical protein